MVTNDYVKMHSKLEIYKNEINPWWGTVSVCVCVCVCVFVCVFGGGPSYCPADQHLSHLMRKPRICISKNKVADQLRAFVSLHG